MIVRTGREFCRGSTWFLIRCTTSLVIGFATATKRPSSVMAFWARAGDAEANIPPSTAAAGMARDRIRMRITGSFLRDELEAGTKPTVQTDYNGPATYRK